MSTQKPTVKQASGKPKSWVKDKSRFPKPPSDYQGVPILRYVEGKESPDYLLWSRALFKVAVEKFGVHANFIKSGKRFKPLGMESIKINLHPMRTMTMKTQRMAAIMGKKKKLKIRKMRKINQRK